MAVFEGWSLTLRKHKKNLKMLEFPDGKLSPVVKDPGLSLLWLGSLLWCGLSPGPGTSICHGGKKKKKEEKLKYVAPGMLYCF